MPTRVQNEATGGLISYFYTDTLTNKPITVAKTETQVTNAQACIMLKELPYRFTRVRLTDSTMIEVDNADEVLTVKHYYVNYNNGMVYFHPSVGSKVFTFNYDSIGYVYTTSTRIATQWDGTTVIETLQDMMDTMNHAILVSTTYATADDLIRDIEARTLACKNSIDTKVTNANASVDAKITEANNKITDVNTVITTANTTKASLQNIIDNGNINNYQLKTDNTLSTTSKTVIGAINENKTAILSNTTNISSHTTAIENLSTALGVNTDDITKYSKPYIEGVISITLGAGETVKSTSVPHNLGYPPRNMIYTKLMSGGTIYMYPFPYISYVTYSSGSLTIGTLGRAWVNNTTVEVVFNRPIDLATTSETFDIKYYLFKD